MVKDQMLLQSDSYASNNCSIYRMRKTAGTKVTKVTDCNSSGALLSIHRRENVTAIPIFPNFSHIYIIKANNLQIVLLLLFLL